MEWLVIQLSDCLFADTAVMLRVLTKQQDGHTVRLTAQEAAPQVFHAMFSQVCTAHTARGQLCHLMSVHSSQVRLWLRCAHADASQMFVSLFQLCCECVYDRNASLTRHPGWHCKDRHMSCCVDFKNVVAITQ